MSLIWEYWVEAFLGYTSRDSQYVADYGNSPRKSSGTEI